MINLLNIIYFFNSYLILYFLLIYIFIYINILKIDTNFIKMNSSTTDNVSIEYHSNEKLYSNNDK